MASKNQKPKTNQTSQVAKPAPNRGPNTHNAPNKGPNNPSGPNNNSPKDGKNPAPKKVGYDDGFTHLTGFEAVLHAIWPVRYRKRATADTGELYIKTTLRNLFVYLAFLVVISIVVYGMIGLINFYYSDGMLGMFVNEDIGNGRKFSTGFITYDDVWTFLEDVFTEKLYYDVWYDLSNTTQSNLGYILYQNKLLGVPRIVQVRVQNNSCTLSSVMTKRNTVADCIAPYSNDIASKAPFGKGLTGIFQNDTTYSAWFYTVEPDPTTISYSGWISSYPSDGFVINLGETKDDTIAILEDLKQNLWIDIFTRAVMIDFTVYNGNINLFDYIRLVIEFPASGGILTSWVTRTSKLLRYTAGFDYVVATFEVIFVLFTVYFTIEELLDFRLNKKRYFMDIYNIMDLFTISMSYVTIGLGIYRTVLVGTTLDGLLSNAYGYQSFDKLTRYQEIFNQITAILVFFCWIKIFKYISLNKTLDQLNATMRKSVVDILYFCIIFVIIMVSFSAMGYLLFGDTLEDYNTFTITLFTLFRIILGDFDFVSLRNSFPYIGPAYFMAFVFFGFFVLLNMFMAIINQAYGKVKEEMNAAQPDFMLSDYLKLNYSKMVDRLNLKRDRILDIQAVLKSDEVTQKDELDFNVWRTELKKKGYADMEIQALFSRYDKRLQKRLTEVEKIKLIRDIARARTVITKEFKDFKKSRDLGAKKDAFEVGDNFFDDDDDELTQAKQMTRDDFDYIVGRIDFMELSVASIINKIDRLFGHLEGMEVEKMKKRQELAKMLQEPNNSKIEEGIRNIMR